MMTSTGLMNLFFALLFADIDHYDATSEQCFTINYMLGMGCLYFSSTTANTLSFSFLTRKQWNVVVVLSLTFHLIILCYVGYEIINDGEFNQLLRDCIIYQITVMLQVISWIVLATNTILFKKLVCQVLHKKK
jgi:hypothetical protein